MYRKRARCIKLVIMLFIRHYDEVTVYMDYDVVPLDNNATELAIRALVMGKQNYLFCQNEQSCYYAAVMYTFLLLAKF